MNAFLAGDAKSFERLFRLLSPKVAAALTQMSGDARLAEDLTQVTFLKLYRARGAYQRDMLLTPWLYAIARNTYFDHRRRLRRSAECLSSDGVLPELDDQTPIHSEGHARASLDELLGAIPQSQREALWLLKVQGYSAVEAAALCGTTPASIKMRVHRAYRALRSTLLSGKQT